MNGGLEAVFAANRGVLLRFLRARGAGDDAEDLLQEVWIRVSTLASGPIADPLAYLFRTANNLLLDRKRSEARSARRDHEWAEARGVEPDRPAEDALIARSDLEQADAALRALGQRTD